MDREQERDTVEKRREKIISHVQHEIVMHSYKCMTYASRLNSSLCSILAVLSVMFHRYKHELAHLLTSKPCQQEKLYTPVHDSITIP